MRLNPGNETLAEIRGHNRPRFARHPCNDLRYSGLANSADTPYCDYVYVVAALLHLPIPRFERLISN